MSQPQIAVTGIGINSAFGSGIEVNLAALKAGGSGVISAPETSHALAATIDEALKAKEEGKEKVILFNYSGHGLMDLSAYDAYLSGKLSDYELPQEEIEKYTVDLQNLPKAEVRKTGKW